MRYKNDLLYEHAKALVKKRDSNDSTVDWTNDTSEYELFMIEHILRQLPFHHTSEQAFSQIEPFWKRFIQAL
jgi:hypothetical protein